MTTRRTAHNANLDYCDSCNKRRELFYVDVEERSLCDQCITGNTHKGHTNTAAKTHTSHAGHDHPATPKARAACRKARDSK